MTSLDFKSLFFFYFISFRLTHRARLLLAEEELQAANEALSRGGRILQSELATLKGNYKAINAELREKALSRCEENYIRDSRGASPCWQLLKFLSKDDSTPNIPPSAISTHFKGVYYKTHHPACLRFMSTLSLFVFQFPA